MRSRFFAIALVAAAAHAASAAVLYVDAAHCPSGDGTTWGTAFCTIQEAITAASDGDGVFVKKGTYAEAITMRSNVFVFGGFDGTETTPDQRNIPANDTIIDVSTLTGTSAVRMETLSNTRIDGFVITGGETQPNGGGGLVAAGLDNTCSIGNCTFVGNSAVNGLGGGIYLSECTVAVENCSFLRNRAYTGGGIYAGSCDGVTVAGCVFIGNTADYQGGAVYAEYSNIELSNCTAVSNFGGNSGGGLSLRNCEVATINQGQFFDNTADGGAAILVYNPDTETALATIERCVVENSGGRFGAIRVYHGNSQILDTLIARNAAGISFDGGRHNVSQSTIAANNTNGIRVIQGAVVSLNNSILADNTAAAISSDGAPVAPGNCLFYGNQQDLQTDSFGSVDGADEINNNVPGAVDNVGQAPDFRDADALDFHLLATSAAIGAASAIYATYTDLDGVARPTVQGQIDIGAYQFSDLVGPSVVSITRAGVSPTNGAGVAFNVAFDEAVTGVDASDFQVATAGAKAISGASIANVSGSGAAYLVTVNTGTGDGTLALGLIDNNSIADLTGNPLGGAGAGNGNFTDGEEFIIDKTPPVLSLTSGDPLTLEAGSFYSEPGFTATDNLDGDITNRVGIAGFVNVGELGDYAITYSVSDSAGNSASATRSVSVVDTTPPLITLLGQNPVDISFGEVYTDPGATAYDIVDGDVTSSLVVTPPADASGPGTYTFAYTAQDLSGNSATAVRVLNITDDTAPVITVNGDAHVTVNLGDTYTDAGATANDDVDGDLTSEIEITGALTTSVPGEYTITYSVSDSAGNHSTAARTVTVLDRPDFYVTPEYQFISVVARTVVFDVYNRSTAQQTWTATVTEGQSWCRITGPATGDQFYGQLYLECDENTSTQRRDAKIQFTSSDKFSLPIEVTISQAPQPKGFFGCGGSSAPSNGPAGDIATVALLTAALAFGTYRRSLVK